MYIKRDKDGNITAVSAEPEAGFNEASDEDRQDITAFLAATRDGAALSFSDLDFVRVLEDLLEVLMEKGAIAFTDLPNYAQEKMIERGKLRELRRESLELLDDEGLI